eukprot:scaffold10963_cov84-Skeletonema_marinoi.AAC.8
MLCCSKSQLYQTRTHFICAEYRVQCTPSKPGEKCKCNYRRHGIVDGNGGNHPQCTTDGVSAAPECAALPVFVFGEHKRKRVLFTCMLVADDADALGVSLTDGTELVDDV